MGAEHHEPDSKSIWRKSSGAGHLRHNERPGSQAKKVHGAMHSQMSLQRRVVLRIVNQVIGGNDIPAVLGIGFEDRILRPRHAEDLAVLADHLTPE